MTRRMPVTSLSHDAVAPGHEVAAAAAAVVETTTTGLRSAGRNALRVPSVLRCGFMIFLMKMSLQTRGFSRTIGWIRRRVEARPKVASVDLEAIKATEYAVAMAGGLYPGRALCLEQSLTLYYVLRRQGVDVIYCQGAQPYPFLAHAWVEYRGDPVNDIAEHVKQFARLPEPLG